MSYPALVVTGDTDAQFAQAEIAVRRQIAFYASTPAYRTVLELHGWGDLHAELNRLSKQGEWDTMGTLIDDDVLGAFAVVSPLEEVGAALTSRCEGVADRVMPTFYGASRSCISAALKEFRQ